MLAALCFADMGFLFCSFILTHRSIGTFSQQHILLKVFYWFICDSIFEDQTFKEFLSGCGMPLPCQPCGEYFYYCEFVYWKIPGIQGINWLFKPYDSDIFSRQFFIRTGIKSERWLEVQNKQLQKYFVGFFFVRNFCKL